MISDTPGWGHDERTIADPLMNLNRRVRRVAARWSQRRAKGGGVALLDAYALLMSHPRKHDPSFWQGGAGWHMHEPGVITHAIAMCLLDLICPPW